MTESIEQINQNLWESLAYDMKFNMELWYLGEIQGYNILAKFYINMSDEKIVRICLRNQNGGKSNRRQLNLKGVYESRTDENGVLIPEKKLTEAERRKHLRAQTASCWLGVDRRV